MRAVPTAACILMSMATLASPPQENKCPIATIGHYANGQYRFSFTVPPGLSGQWQSPCTMDEKYGCVCLGDHGLAFDLPDGGKLGVFADYAAELDEPTIGAALEEARKRIQGAGEHIDAVSKTKFKGRPGFIIVATDRGKNGDGVADFRRIEYLFLSDDGRVDIYLHGTAGSWRHDREILDRLLESWKWGI